VGAIALPRHVLTGDLRRMIEGLDPQAAGTDRNRFVAGSRSSEVRNGIEPAIAPAHLLPTAIAAGRRAGLLLALAKQVSPQAASDLGRRVRIEGTATFEEVLGFLDEIGVAAPGLSVDTLSISHPAAAGAEPVRLNFDCTLSLEAQPPTRAAVNQP
jgi:hypothetical protein